MELRKDYTFIQDLKKLLCFSNSNDAQMLWI